MSQSDSRRIRVLIAKPGLDGHDVGAKLVCRALMEAGMEVTYTGLRQSPEAIVQAAAQERVDVVGLSVLSGAHLPLCAEVSKRMSAAGLDGALLVVGGNIPGRDAAALTELGVDRIFPTGAHFDSMVAYLRENVRP